jgi:Helix-turn-helix domain
MSNRTDRRSAADAPPAPNGLHLSIDPAGLEPLIRAVVSATLAALDDDRAAMPADKVAFPEAEAARLLSLNPHQLRDERRLGRIKASVGPGRKILYSRQDLLNYLGARRWEAQ